MSQIRIARLSHYAAFASLLLAGCAAETQAGGGADTASTQAAELEAAQCSFESFGVAADACKADFESCIDKTQDLQGCQQTLDACLPMLPPLPAGPGGPGKPGLDNCDDGPTGKPTEPPSLFDAGGAGPSPSLPEPPKPGQPIDPVPAVDDAGTGAPSGGEPLPPKPGAPPPAPPVGAGVPNGGGPLPPLPKPGAGHPLPAPEVVNACHSELKTCLQGLAQGADPKACFEVVRACVENAFAQAFDAHCDDIGVKCSEGAIPGGPCEKISARCEAGVAPKPGAPVGVRCGGQPGQPGQPGKPGKPANVITTE